jgi:hypothetical protein
VKAPDVMRFVLLACALSAACHSTALVGRQCEGGTCSKSDACAGSACPPTLPDMPPPVQMDASEPRPDPGPRDAGCDAMSCAPPLPEASPMLDAEPPAAPSCEGGTCQAGVCDGGACEPEEGCNATYPICARCSDDDDCDDGDPEERYCDTARGRCVECLASEDCANSEPFCRRGECDECMTDDHCLGGLRCRNGECGID